MRDPIRDLENFHPEGTPVNPMPASEVRRRGDRMRRRNNALATVGGVAAALAAVAVPLTVVNGDEPGRELQPAPPATEWRQEVPDEFPLGAGLGEPLVREIDPSIPNTCGTPFWGREGTTDVEGVTVSGGESFTSRTLAVYPDAAAAQQALAGIRSAAADCPEEPDSPDDTTLFYEVLDRDLGTEDSLVLVEQVRFDDGLVSDATVTLVGRTGNAILLDQAYSSAGGDEVVEQIVRNRQELGAEPWTSMCVFAADPCDLGSAPGEERQGGSAAGAEIPDDFPLLAGFPEAASGDAVRTGPSRDLEPLVPEACGTQAPVPAHGDLVRAGFSGHSDGRERQLVTFATEDEADAYVDAVMAVFDDCMEVETGSTTRFTFTVSELTGPWDRAGGAVTRYEVDGEPVPGLSTLVVARSGSAVLVSLRETEEGGTDPGADTQEAFNRHLEDDRPAIEAMQDL